MRATCWVEIRLFCRLGLDDGWWGLQCSGLRHYSFFRSRRALCPHLRHQPPPSGCASPGSLPGDGFPSPKLGGCVGALACPHFVLLLEVSLSLHCARRIGLKFYLVCSRSSSVLMWADVAKVQGTELLPKLRSAFPTPAPCPSCRSLPVYRRRHCFSFLDHRPSRPPRSSSRPATLAASWLWRHHCSVLFAPVPLPRGRHDRLAARGFLSAL